MPKLPNMSQEAVQKRKMMTHKDRMVEAKEPPKKVSPPKPRIAKSR